MNDQLCEPADLDLDQAIDALDNARTALKRHRNARAADPNTSPAALRRLSTYTATLDAIAALLDLDVRQAAAPDGAPSNEPTEPA